jgi:hypothetical protein
MTLPVVRSISVLIERPTEREATIEDRRSGDRAAEW